MRNEPIADHNLIREVEQFLYREARLLDERRFREWLELFTDDVRYWMGSRSNRYPRSSKAISILSPNRYVEDDHTREDELSIFDETKETLTRLERLVGDLNETLAYMDSCRSCEPTHNPAECGTCDIHGHDGRAPLLVEGISK